LNRVAAAPEDIVKEKQHFQLERRTSACARMDDSEDERPSKRQKLDAQGDADLLLDLGSDDWSNDLEEQELVLSAVVPVEEEEILLPASQAMMDEEESYWQGAGNDEELLMAASFDPNQAFVQSSAPQEPSQPNSNDFDAMFTSARRDFEPLPTQREPSQRAAVPPSQAQEDLKSSQPGFDASQPPAVTFEMAFKTAGGQKLAPPSKEALARAERLLASPTLQPIEETTDLPSTPTLELPQRLPALMHDSPTAMRGQQQLAKPAPKPHPLSQVQSFVPPTSSPRPPNTPQRSQMGTPQRSQLIPTQGSDFQTPRLDPRARLATKPFNAAPTPSPISQRRSQTPGSVFGPSQSRSQPSQTASQKTTIDLRMSAMKASQALSQRPKFVPPFKGGKRPTDQDLQKFQQEIKARSASQQAAVVQPTQRKGPAAKQGKWKPFFNLKGALSGFFL
jgi:hypothetical protein